METKRTGTDSTDKLQLTDLPVEIFALIFKYLSVVDMSHVASCNRRLRYVANTDLIWRPLCLRNGWERYGSITDLTKEIPYTPQDVSGGRNDVSFNMAAIVRQDSTMDLVATCRWKEIYMKANHLENNWKNKRFHVSNLKPRDMDAGLHSRSVVRKVVIDKDCLVVVMSNETIQIWDVKTQTCRHLIPAFGERVACLSVFNGKTAVGSRNEVIRIFSIETGEILHVKQERTNTDYMDRLFMDTELVISVAIPLFITEDNAKHKHINVWNVEDGALRHTFKIDVEGAILRDVDYRDKMVVGAYSDKCLRLWDAVTGDCLLQPLRYNCEGISKSLSCCLGNSIIALADFDGMMFFVWNKQSGECVTSVSILKDYKCQVGLPGTCEAVDDLTVVYLQSRSGRYFNLYNHKGELLKNQYDKTQCYWKQPICICCYRKTFLVQGLHGCEMCGIYKTVSRNSQQICQSTPKRFRLEASDDTKMITSLGSRLTIFHYW
ncbi:uncharacterized protein [Asterias amurensis]|uniref:uncharacterized protein n=1 Tax=Asterias amurensis TaxID=7602 RepID=UPI003AB6497F